MLDTSFSFDTVSVNYLTDEEGKKTGVVIPIADWLEIKKLVEYNSLKDDFLHAFQEMHEMRNGIKPKLSLNDVINEL